MANEIKQSDWITHREAASILSCHESALRRRTRAGRWALWPGLARIQHRRGGKIYLIRRDVEAFKRQLEEGARSLAEATKPQTGAIPVPARVLEIFQRIGATRTLKSLGVKR